MSDPSRLLYCPALRMKAGELAGVQQLRQDIADFIAPRFIVPPRSEREITEPVLFDIRNTPDISRALAAHWRGRPLFVDITHIINEYGRDTLLSWVPALFR